MVEKTDPLARRALSAIETRGPREMIARRTLRESRRQGVLHPKIRFHETIKEIEQRLGDANMSLQSFIVSNTSSATMRTRWNMEKSEMQERHVLFQEEDQESYVGTMLQSASAG